MAEVKTQNLVSKPPLQAKLIDPNGLMNRAWSVWFRDLYRRVAYKGGNAIDNNIEDIDDLVASVEKNIASILENKSAIEENTSDIAINIIDIAQNEISIDQLTISLNSHISRSEAHGSNGDIVGFNDLAEEAKRGIVKRMALIADAVDTAVNITTTDIPAAPAVYDQAYMQLVADLTNENKAAINSIASDLNSAILVLNNLLSESKSSGQMTS